MTQDELVALLNAHEWRDVEFKAAQREVPRNAYETVSAFANTEGGHLVFGVKKDDAEFEVVGVLEVDKVQNEFITALRQRDKISVVLDVRESLHKHNGSDLLVFHIPEAHRSEKPVYLNGTLSRSYVRRGACNVRCSEDERNRFLIDAASKRYDSQAVDLDMSTAFDDDSIGWYRASYEGRTDNRSYTGVSDLDFLSEMGLLVEQHGNRKPTRAAVFLFGTNAAFRQLLPRPVVDCQYFSVERNQADTGQRWADRTVLDENLVKTWQALVDWYRRRADQPFKIDPATLHRDDTPPDYLAYRESMVNLLIHQDYSDHSRKPEIRHYADQTLFWNPGDAFAAGADLWEPGEREVRNPCIVTAFRRIGLSENAGWGLRDVSRNWQQLGHVPPRIHNDKSRKSFELVLVKEELLSEQQILFAASLGVHLSDEQARAFAFVCRERDVTLSQLKAVTGLGGPDAVALADALVTQALLTPIEQGKRYGLAEHLAARFDPTEQASDGAQDGTENLITDQVDQKNGHIGTDHVELHKGNLVSAKVTKLTGRAYRLLALCEVPHALSDLLESVGLSNRSYFKTKHLNPLINHGLLRMTKPEKPRAKDQKYVVTPEGLQIVEKRKKADSEIQDDDSEST